MRIRALGEDVDLDLRLGAARAHDDVRAVAELEAQHVRARERDLRDLAACGVARGAIRIILVRRDLDARDLARRRLAQGLHKSGHLLRTI